MIKNDYKPRKISQPIFSQKKTFSRAPLILASVSIVLIVWGLSQTVFDSESDSIVSQEQDIPLQTEQPTDEKRSYEIPLNLGEEQLESEQQTQRAPLRALPVRQPTRSEDDTPEQMTESEAVVWQSSRIRSGDSTARVFQRHKLSPTDLHNIMQLGTATKTLERIQAGHLFEYSLTSDGDLYGIRYHIDRLNMLEVLRVNDEWTAVTHAESVEVRQASATGTIRSSLFTAGKQAGMSDSLVMELAGIFGWDIDFILDIRHGDRFTVIYEEKYVDGEKYTNGNILAAEFVNQGKSYQAVRYEDSKGNAEYFSPDGYSMRKAFLRAPVDFSYVSSHFNPRRFHPVTKQVRPHRGIDYVAPVGTPIKAAGDGKVVRSGYDKLNGHHVFIQHGQKYTTKYLHFQKRKVRVGQRVKQGQIIGTLGGTGRVTGPHLHYEFLVNGVHRNPKTVKLPDAAPVKKSERDRFFQMSRPLIAQLQTYSDNSQIRVAEAE